MRIQAGQPLSARAVRRLATKRRRGRYVGTYNISDFSGLALDVTPALPPKQRKDAA
jgi:hypothetical protein